MNNCCKGLFWISQGKVATGEVEKSARFSCEISQDLMCQKSLKSVNLWQSYSTNKRWTFWGYGVYLFCGWNPHPPRKTSLGAWIGVFKPNGQNIESFILSKLLHQFQQVLQNDRDYQVFNVGYPNTRPTNPKWRTAAILRKKTVKSPYLCNRWQISVKFDALTHIGPLRRNDHYNFKFLNIQDEVGRYLEKHKNRVISGTVWRIFTEFGRVMQTGSDR